MEEYTFSTHVCRNRKEMKATQGDLMVISEGLGNNIIKQVGTIELGKSVRIFIRNRNNKVVGGIIGDVFGGWVYIALLWVEESLRNKGYGTKLVNLIEEEARKLGCKYAHLDTYSFEARPFYEKLGYGVFGTLEDYPEGYCKYFLKKVLR